MNRKDAILIIPYYGKLPSYFELWLQSAQNNSHIMFMVVSDLLDNYNLPDNVVVLSWSFNTLKEWIQSKFDFKISLDNPYKLCDFKVAYGMIFAEYIRDYRYWGHCDIDLIFGDMERLVGSLLEEYDVIGDWGHFSLYRNEEKFVNLFKQSGALFDYKEVFTKPYIYAFDETTGIRRIIKKDCSIKSVAVPCVADISHKYKKMRIARADNFSGQIFIWERGKLFQCYPLNTGLEYRELSYIHMQKRKMDIMWEKNTLNDSFFIVDNGFLVRNGDTEDIIYCKKNSSRFEGQMRLVDVAFFNLKKVIDYMFMSKEQRKINIKKRKIS